MIPRVGKGGASFGDAVAYYAHDKGASTSERVEWAVAQNLPINTELGDKPEQIDAMKKCGTIMQWTADHQADIKLAAGGSMAGRPMTKPAYTYSLSWAPGEEISKAEMLKAANDTLKLLGLEKHQTLIVAHNDTHMPHVHCIVNRVNPQHGRTASKSCDRLILSEWAEKYEQKRGKILVPQRVLNNQQRAANAETFNRLKSPGDPTKIVKGENLSREERARLNAYDKLSDSQIRAQRTAQQVVERSDVTRRMRTRHANMTADINKTYGERREALKTQLADTEARIGAKGWFRQAIRRVTGHQQRDIEAAANLKKSLADLAQRTNERAGEIRRQALYEIRRFKTRQGNERGRDEEFIAKRQRARQEAAEARALKAKAPKSKAPKSTRGENRTPGRKRDRSQQRTDVREATTEQTKAAKEDDGLSRSERIAKMREQQKSKQRDKSRDYGAGD